MSCQSLERQVSELSILILIIVINIDQQILKEEKRLSAGKKPADLKTVIKSKIRENLKQ